MSKYVVETFYTCTFKIIHKLDELNEKKLSELENRKDGEFELIDVKLNNRKTKTTVGKESTSSKQSSLRESNISEVSSMINEKISIPSKLANSNELLMPNIVPYHLLQETNRWNKFGLELLKFTDRHYRHFCCRNILMPP